MKIMISGIWCSIIAKAKISLKASTDNEIDQMLHGHDF